MLAACLAALTITSSAAPVKLKSGVFDPSLYGSAQRSAGQASSDDYRLVQFKSTITKADRALIERTGAKIIGYIPDYCLLVKVKKDELDSLKGRKEIAWAGDLLPSYRMSPEIKSISQPIRVQLFPGESDNDIIQSVLESGATIERVNTSESGTVIEVYGTGAMARRIASIAGVRWVEPMPKPRLLNNVARGLASVNPVWSTQYYFGQGQVVAVCDTGLDTGAQNPSLHQDFQGRVHAAFALGRPGLTNDPNGHGTHVAGTVLGSGKLSGSNPITHDYAASFAGAAPEARLVFQSVLDAYGSLGGLPVNLNTLFQQAYEAGARIHTNSWGSAVYGSYDIYSKQVDEFVWNNPDMVTVFAAGNAGSDRNSDGVIDFGSIGSPATAKNCIAVGASESDRTSGGYTFPWGTGSWAENFPVDPIKSDYLSDNPGGMAAFSSRGPCDDGRIKPDIVAPGTNIISCRSREPYSGTLWGVYNSDYSYSGGTSMAAPLVAGAAALVRQHFVDTMGRLPSAALIKAALLAAARDLTPGQYGTDIYQEIAKRPNNVEGWGLVDVKSAIAPESPTIIKYFDDSEGLHTGEQKSFTYSVINGSVPLRVIIVWSDYPGDPSAAQALVNDLDLTVMTPSNQLLNGNGSLDRMNNVESVDIDNPEAGTYRITVGGYNVPYGPQKFALVVSGGLPDSSISGTVLSQSGRPVPNATITAQSGSQSFSTQTAPNGTYTIEVVPGEYEVSATKSGWTFSPPSRNVEVGDLPSSQINYTGSAPVSSITGFVRIPSVETYASALESSHPYANLENSKVTVRGPESAIRLRVHFTKIDVERSFDNVYIKDTLNNTYAVYSGQASDFWSPWVDGNELVISLQTDYSIVQYGWQIDKYQATVPGAAFQGAQVTETSAGKSGHSQADGRFVIENVEPLPTVLRPIASRYIFRPESKAVTPEPGGAYSAGEFIAIPEPPVVHVGISHTYVGDLIVTLGVGDPDSPVYSRIIANRIGGSADGLNLSVELDDALQYFPPTADRPWFVKVCDVAEGDSGTIDSAAVSFGGQKWWATNAPVTIGDMSCGTARIPASLPDTIHGAREKLDGQQVLIWGAVVTQKSGTSSYIQAIDRSSGIRVFGSDVGSVGDLVQVSGQMQTNGCERAIANAKVYVVTQGYGEPKPLKMLGRALGGKAPDSITPGFPNTEHLYNVGLLVETTGLVTAAGADWFYVWDTSNANDLSGFLGTHVLAGGFNIPPAGSYVIVRGISGCSNELESGNMRVIRVRSNADIRVATSSVMIFTDDFEAGADNWQADSDGQLMSLTEERHHTGRASFYCAPGKNGAVHNLGITADASASLIGWFYDNGTNGDVDFRLELRAFGDQDAIVDRIAIGLKTSVSPTHYSIFSSNTAAPSTAARSTGWHKFQIKLGATGIPGQDISFFVDDILVGSGIRAISGMRRYDIALGSPGYNSQGECWFDDIAYRFGN